MHISIPISGTLSGKLEGDVLSNQLQQLQQAQQTLEAVGLKLEVKLGDPVLTGNMTTVDLLIPTDAPCPEPTDFEDIEQQLTTIEHRHRYPKISREAERRWVCEHLGYFRDAPTQAQEVVMAYYNPRGAGYRTRKEAAKLTNLSTYQLGSRQEGAWHHAVDYLENLRRTLAASITPETAWTAPIAALDIEFDSRNNLRELGIKSIGDLVEKSQAELEEHLEVQHLGNYWQKINEALATWNLSLKD